jgi:uncharacterized protein DUF4159
MWAVVGVGLLVGLFAWAASSMREKEASVKPPDVPQVVAKGQPSKPPPPEFPATRPTAVLPAYKPETRAAVEPEKRDVRVDATTLPVAPPEPAVAPVRPAPVVPRPPTTRHAVVETEVTDAQIGRSIGRAVDYLLGQFSPSTNRLRDFDPDLNKLKIGEDVLCVYALLQASQAIDDPRLNPKEARMKGMVTAMKQLRLGRYHWEVYARGLRATALSVYDQPEDRATLNEDVTALLRGEHRGAYTYRTSVPKNYSVFDNSNSQYGLLGVWSGAEVGREVPRAYWEAVSKHWETAQAADGEWGYRGGGRYGYHSMTCAGLASLFVAHDYLEPARFTGNVGREPFIPAISRGLQWLEAGGNSIDLDRGGYNLYGLERVGLASGFKYFGSHDWYRELAALTISDQQPDGSFSGEKFGSYGARIETAYNLLFLARGRHPILMNKLRFDGYWANRPRDVANLARFASHQLERPLNWQVVPLSRDWTEWTDSPILYLASHEAVKLTDEDVAKIRSFVENGGLLYTQADGDSPEFNAFAAQLAGRLFPAYEMADLPPNHPVYSAMFRLQPVPGLRAVSNGSRLLMVHSTTDLARYWELRDFKTKTEIFQWGTNLFIYAAGKRDLRNRLESPVIPAPAFAPANTVRVVRLSYDGNWNPEPGAWPRFARWFARETGYGLDLSEVPVARLKPGTAEVAVLTGTSRHDMTDAEAAAIKAYVEAGGVVLVDACGGAGDFSAGLESSLYLKTFSTAPPRTISSSHPVLCGGADGLEDLSRPRLRAFAVESVGAEGGFPEEIAAGRGHLLTTRLDITTGLLGTQTWGVRGYDPDYALRLVKNVLLWTLDGQHE